MSALWSTRRISTPDLLLAADTASFHVIEASATSTQDQMLSLVQVQTSLKDQVRASSLRADSAHTAVDFAVGHPSFTVRDLQGALGLTYGRTNRLVEQLIEIDVLRPLAQSDTYNRRFHAPLVLEVLLRS